jgi:hypothetical protein
MSDESPIALLRRAAVALRAGALDHRDAMQIADCFETYLTNAAVGMTLDGAFDLKLSDGEEPWWIFEKRCDRDRFVAEFLDRYLPTEPGDDIRRYETGRWRHDRRRPAMPANYAGTQFELLFLAFKANDVVAPGNMPSSRSYLRRIRLNHSAATINAVHEPTPVAEPKRLAGSNHDARGPSHASSEKCAVC